MQFHEDLVPHGRFAKSSDRSVVAGFRRESIACAAIDGFAAGDVQRAVGSRM